MSSVLGTDAPSRLLAGLRDPGDLRDLPPYVLPTLAAEIRSELIRQVCRTGGHLGPNLGVVELTIALHRVFHSPDDAIVWDTGHQAYVHKMLTGRLGSFGTLRQAAGLSGYPNRLESPHDLVENSHASTALGYADGIAKAFELSGNRSRHVVAVVGDGALTGGMCWEALNNIAAAPSRPVVVVLNDNGRSYEPTAGYLPRHLRQLRDGVARGNLFEDMGFAYVGPVDGHDLAGLDRALRAAAVLRCPVVVHCVTTKGKGYAPAEEDEADRMHTVGPATAESDSGPSWTSLFGDVLLEIGRQRPDVVAITAAMLRPTGLLPFAAEFPDRVFDVGIAEQHAVASAAGLAAEGLHPIVAIYSTFLNRAFDQVLMDASLHHAPVTFVLDRAGITGPDGPSHHGIWDVGLFGLVPGVRVAAPRDPEQLRVLLHECVACDEGPTVLRFPRGQGGRSLSAVGAWGSASVLRIEPDAETLLLPVGPLAEAALDAAAELQRYGVPTVVADPRWVRPLDPELVQAAARFRDVFTVEDNAPSGGFGDMLARELRQAHVTTWLHSLTLPADFVAAGPRDELLHAHGLDADGIVHAVLATIEARQVPAGRR
jgi:1-deoxy-D-xylulose-5-phosphate synthase